MDQAKVRTAGATESKDLERKEMVVKVKVKEKEKEKEKITGTVMTRGPGIRMERATMAGVDNLVSTSSNKVLGVHQGKAKVKAMVEFNRNSSSSSSKGKQEILGANP